MKQIRDELTHWPQYVACRFAAAKTFAQDTVKAAILTGAVRSPANFKDTMKFPWKCVACEELGSHDHIYWQCDKVEEICGTRPIGVTDRIQRRYGLPMCQDADKDAEVLDWMKLVTLQIWEVRYGNADKKRIKQLALKKRRRNAEEQKDIDDEKDDTEELEKWLAKKAACEEAAEVGGKDDDDGDFEEEDVLDMKGEDLADLNAAVQEGLLASGDTFACGR